MIGKTKKFKKINLLFAVALLAVPLFADPPPVRYAREVQDTNQKYDMKWVIKPSEEPAGDHKVGNAPECDILGVSAASDANRLRIDIILANSYSRKLKVFYAFEVRYKNNIREGYLYYPINGEFRYIKWQGNKVVERKQLDKSPDGDNAVIVARYAKGKKIPDAAVSLFIKKDGHIGGDKGKKLWVTARVYSGYVSKKTKGIKEADRTPEIRLGFIR